MSAFPFFFSLTTLIIISATFLHCPATSTADGTPYGWDATTIAPPTGVACTNCNICPYPCHGAQTTPPPPPPDPSSYVAPPPPKQDQSNCPPPPPSACCGGGSGGGGGTRGGEVYAPPPPPFYYPYNDSSAAAGRPAGFLSVHVACAVWLWRVAVMIA